MKSLLIFGVAMAVAMACAFIFSNTLLNIYPDGILVFPPVGEAPPVPSDSLHIGMAIGWFFALLCYSVMALSAWVLVRFGLVEMRRFPLPLLAAALTCLILLLTSIYLAG